MRFKENTVHIVAYLDRSQRRFTFKMSRNYLELETQKYLNRNFKQIPKNSRNVLTKKLFRRMSRLEKILEKIVKILELKTNFKKIPEKFLNWGKKNS